jgi:uncharacterized protein YecT (DUF1311 family)
MFRKRRDYVGARAFLMGIAAAALLSLPTVGAEPCVNTATQSALTRCATEAYADAEAEMEAIYGQVAARLREEPSTAKLLGEAQSAWAVFRDAHCRFTTSGTAGGSIQPMLYAACLERITRARSKDLDAWLSCEEGDLTCPVPQ